MSKHTPGKWQLEDTDPNEEYEIFVPAPIGRYVIATVCYGYQEPFESQQHANAKLIAAAPELLEALETLLESNDGFGRFLSRDLDKARAIVAKLNGDPT